MILDTNQSVLCRMPPLFNKSTENRGERSGLGINQSAAVQPLLLNL